MNLLKETNEILAEHGKGWDDVRYICLGSYDVSIDGFISRASLKEYDDGYGVAWIREDLYIVGDDWWLERAEYDGSEWWEFKQKPDRPYDYIDDRELWELI